MLHLALARYNAYDLSIGSTSGNDTITVDPGTLAGTLKVTLNGAVQDNLSAAGETFIYGLGGDDTITVNAALSGGLIVAGQGGADNYTVNFGRLAEVTGNIGLAAWYYGGNGDDRLKGGAGHDVLLGEAGDDMLVGGNGRDMLVGGTGADKIVGNADDDILIAGWLNFGDLNGAIADIMAEWTSTRAYLTRIANLRGTGTGASFEQRLNGATFLTPGVTVVGDDSRDVLTGSVGQDWFLFDDDLDRATDLKDEVFANELDFILS